MVFPPGGFCSSFSCLGIHEKTTRFLTTLLQGSVSRSWKRLAGSPWSPRRMALTQASMACSGPQRPATRYGVTTCYKTNHIICSLHFSQSWKVWHTHILCRMMCIQNQQLFNYYADITKWIYNIYKCVFDISCVIRQMSARIFIPEGWCQRCGLHPFLWLHKAWCTQPRGDQHAWGHCWESSFPQHPTSLGSVLRTQQFWFYNPQKIMWFSQIFWNRIFSCSYSIA